jgi:predicted membrane protein
LDQQNPRVGYRGGLSARVKDLLRKVAAILLGAALVAGAFVVSIVFFAAVFAIALVFAGYLWWKTRQLRKQMRQRVDQSDVIEGTVLKSE